jgi:hypothetical protein
MPHLRAASGFSLHLPIGGRQDPIDLLLHISGRRLTSSRSPLNTVAISTP